MKLNLLKIVLYVCINALFAFNAYAQTTGLITLLNENKTYLSAEQQQVLHYVRSLPYTRQAQLVNIGDIAQLQQNGTISFQIPGISNQQYVAQAAMVDYKNKKKYSWAGNIDHIAVGKLALVAENGHIAGFIQLADKYYTIYPIGTQISILQEHNPTGYEPIQCQTPAHSQAQTLEAEEDPCEPADNDCSAQIDVLVLGTPEAMASFANPWDAVALVGGAFLSLNWAFQNSDIPNKYANYYWEEFDFSFNPSNSATSDINNLVSNEAAQNLRNAYQADIVVLLANDRYPGIAGRVAEILATNSNAYAIVETPFLAEPRWTFAHEIGHLLGGRHSTCDLFSAGGCDDTNICSHGFIFNDADGVQQRTLMSLFADDPNNPNDARLLNYSNPNIIFNGVATGDADHDNVRIIKNHTCKVANFRTLQNLDASIIGYTMLCNYSQPLIPRTYHAEITMPSIGVNVGVGPYNYEWRWSNSGIITALSPGTYLGNGEWVTINSVLACPNFFLHLRVTSNDGIVINRTMFIDSGACSLCYGDGKAESINKIVFGLNYLAESRQIQISIPELYLNNNSALFKLYDTQGRLLKSVPISNFTEVIPIGYLSIGVYIGVLQVENELFTQKITIQ